MQRKYANIRILAVIALLIGVVSCVSDPVYEPEAKLPDMPKIVNSSEGAVAGRMILYVDNATANEWLSAAEPTRAGTEGLSLVVDELDVECIKPVFNLAMNGDIKRERGMHRWFTVEFSEAIDVERAAECLAAMPSIERVEFVKGVMRPEVHVVPVEEVAATRSGEPYPFDDPMLPEQWALNNRGDKEIYSTAMAGEDINAFKAWEHTAGHPSVVVAVVDEGVKYTHPDLAANMWTNTAELNGAEGVDDDGNGYVDDIYGINTIEGNGNISWNNPRYNESGKYIGDVGHGTHVAGIVAAVNNNGIGISSIAGGTGVGDGVRIMSVQMFREGVSSTLDSVASGIEYAADMGASILQCSWGMTATMYVLRPIEEGWCSVVYEALLYFKEYGGGDAMDGGVAIFSAGNSAIHIAGYPGAHHICVAVTATAADGLPTYYTNYNFGCNIAAPGGDYEWVDAKLNPKGAILSTVPSETPNPYSDGKVCYDSDYGYMTGTSMATPYVSGVAALIVSYAVEHGKCLTSAEVTDILYSSVCEIDSRLHGTKRGQSYGGAEWEISLDTYYKKMGIGRVDALHAVSLVADTRIIAASVGTSTYLSLEEHMGSEAAKVKLWDYAIDDDTIARLGITNISAFGSNTLGFICTKSGIGTITLKYVAGIDYKTMETDDREERIAGTIVEKEFVIVARDNNDNGGWL